MMSVTKNNCVRCDWCGRISRNPLGEYTKPDGSSVGYIRAPDWDHLGSKDICDECASKLPKGSCIPVTLRAEG